MSLMEAVRSVFGHYAVFGGRARRSEYWKFTLFNIVVLSVLYLIGGAGGGDSSPLMAIPGLYSLIALLPVLAVAVRRLHDTGRSGWSLFIALIPVVGAILLLVWFCRDGDAGDNAYGPNPKQLFEAEVKPAARPVVEPVVPKKPEPVSPPRTGTCPACGAPVSATAAFCTYCGTSLRGAAPAARKVPPEKKPEEKSAVDDLWQTPTDF